jgi:hypothetical protein
MRYSDDEYVGDSNYFQQPAGRTSVLTGFVYISKLFRSMSLSGRTCREPRLMSSNGSIPAEETGRSTKTAKWSHAPNALE